MKYLHNLQNFQNIEEFLNEVKMHSNNFDVYGISQDSDTKDYILVLIDFNYGNYCIKCNKGYTDVKSKWCRQCQINNLKKDFINWTSGDKRIDNFIREKQLEIDSPQSTILKWIPYDQFSEINEVIHSTSTKFNIYGISSMPNIDDFIIVLQDKGYCIKCNEAYTNITSKWKNGPFHWDENSRIYKRHQDINVILKCLQNTDELLNEARKYSINEEQSNKDNNTNVTIKIYGISQNLDSKDYILIYNDKYLEKYCENCNNMYIYYKWCKLCQLEYLKTSSNEIDKGGFATVYSAMWKYGPLYYNNNEKKYIRNNDKKVALKCLYNSQNITNEFLNEIKEYSIDKHATGRQPFTNCAHDKLLALDICNEIRPEINEQEAPKCYIDLMKKCWDSDPKNRPNSTIIYESFLQFHKAYKGNILIAVINDEEIEIKKQFEEVESYRIVNQLSNENDQSTIHPQAIYISRLLNSFTKELPKYNDNNSECLSCEIK
ncbi:kinase-like domain-containing protein [Rhizophagus irregularis DAOM 181602=DAOM 197198]|nr:kinase-like domain-containing protein [Rhizophagus irregularis DAOM 181602=DAOM 197198]